MFSLFKKEISGFDKKSSETIGYHIFLELDDDFKKEIKKNIEFLSEKYSGPKFEPHITLLARIPGNSDSYIIDKSEDLAKEMKELNLVLGNIDSKESFFQAVFYKIENKDVLEHYHEVAKNIFGINDSAKYFPHASLFYGNITPEIFSKIKKDIVPIENKTFSVNKISIYKTPGSVETWKKIAEINI